MIGMHPTWPLPRYANTFMVLAIHEISRNFFCEVIFILEKSEGFR
jgi:hypothetical protein